MTENNLKQLGNSSEIPSSPDEAILEKIVNPHSDNKYLVRFTIPEFTCLCPITGQPDFAFILIDYVPNEYLIESKSLKLFMTSFRNHNAFHEDTTIGIANRLNNLLLPDWLRIGGYWYPRGGIPIDIFYQTGDPPKGVWVPDSTIPSYRGRG